MRNPRENPASETAKPRDYFATTQWTMVLNAGLSEGTSARDALAELCQRYWYPLYAYVRRRGNSPEDAEDLTQGFFTRLLELNSLAAVRREKGKFRSFLLASLNHYLSDEWDRERALKRGKDRVISLDASVAEERMTLDPADGLTPEKLFERKWAMTLLESAVESVRREYELAGHGSMFMALRFSIVGEKAEESNSTLSITLGLSEASVRVAVHRLRRRFRQLLRDEIGKTVATKPEVDDEIRHLFRALAV